MKRESGWFNKDGLVVGYGTRSVEVNNPAVPHVYGHGGEVAIKLSDLSLLGTDATVGTGIYAPMYYANAPHIPANATVQEVRITTDTAAVTGDAADVLLGLYTISASTGALVVVDADGLCEAGDSAAADFSVEGETIVLAKGASAAYIGKKTVGTSPVVVAAIRVTGSYSAGALSVHVKYTVPAN